VPKLCGDIQVCPVLIRVFFGFGRHHLPADFMRGKTPTNELQLYTWYGRYIHCVCNVLDTMDFIWSVYLFTFLCFDHRLFISVNARSKKNFDM